MRQWLSPGGRLFILTWVVYAYFLGGYVGSVRNNAIADLTVAMVDDHTLAIDPYVGNSNDIATRDGHYYSGFGPGESFLLLPAYLVLKAPLALVPERILARADASLDSRIAAKHGDAKPSKARATVLLLVAVGTLLVSIPLGIAALFAYLRICERWSPSLSPRARLALIGVFAFGSLGFALSTTLTHTAIAAFLIWFALAPTLDSGGVLPPWRWLVAGAFFGFAPSVDYTASLFGAYAALFMLYVAPAADRVRAFALLVAGALGPLLLGFAYHWAAFGNPFTNAYRFRVRVGDRTTFNLGHLQDSLPNLRKLHDGLIHPYSGLILYYPLLFVAGAVVIYWVWRERSRFERAFWLLACATIWTNVGIYCSYPTVCGPASGPGFGVRYAIYSVPFVLICLAQLFERAKTPRQRQLLWGIAAINAVPELLFVAYGAPTWPVRSPTQLFREIGPGTYTLTKLHEVGVLRSALWGWAGLCVIIALLVPWSRLVLQIVRSRRAVH